MHKRRRVSIFHTQFECLTIFSAQFGRSYKFDIEPMNFFNPRDCPLFSIFSFSLLISYCLFPILKDKFSPGPHPFTDLLNSRRLDLVLHSPSLSRQEQAPGTTAVARGWWPKPGQLIWGWHWHEPQPWSPSRFLPGNTTTLTLTLTTVVQVLDNIHL